MEQELEGSHVHELQRPPFRRCATRAEEGEYIKGDETPC